MKTIMRTALLLSLLIVVAFPVTVSAAAAFGVDSEGGWFFGMGSGGGGFGGGHYCDSDICEVADTFIYLINFVLVPLIFAVAFIAFLWGVARAYIISGGDESSREKGHQLILWGIIGFVVMVSLWGLVNVVANTFGLAGYVAPPTPVSY